MYLFSQNRWFYVDINNDIDKWFDRSDISEDIDIQLEKDKNEKVIGKFKDELKDNIMTQLIWLSAKIYAYRLDNDFEMKKPKGTII